MDREKRHLQAQIDELRGRLDRMEAVLTAAAIETAEAVIIGSDDFEPMPVDDGADIADLRADAINYLADDEVVGPADVLEETVDIIEKTVGEELSAKWGFELVHNGFGRYTLYEHGQMLNDIPCSKKSAEEMYAERCKELGIEVGTLVVEDRMEGADA